MQPCYQITLLFLSMLMKSILLEHLSGCERNGLHQTKHSPILCWERVLIVRQEKTLTRVKLKMCGWINMFSSYRCHDFHQKSKWAFNFSNRNQMQFQFADTAVVKEKGVKDLLVKNMYIMAVSCFYSSRASVMEWVEHNSKNHSWSLLQIGIYYGSAQNVTKSAGS